MDPRVFNAALSRSNELNTWDCRLMFNESPPTEDPKVIDLLDFLEPISLSVAFDRDCDVTSYPSHCLYRFPPKRYKGLDAKQKLFRDVCTAANHSSYKLVSGDSKKRMFGKSFTLACSFHYTSRAKDPPLSSDSLYKDNIKKQCIRTNRKIENRGPAGKSMPRKSNRSRPRDKSLICPFHIILFFLFK